MTSVGQWGKQPVHVFNGSIDCLRTIYKREGYWGLNRGMLATLLRTPGLGLYFAAYEFFQQFYKQYMVSEADRVVGTEAS